MPRHIVINQVMYDYRSERSGIGCPDCSLNGDSRNCYAARSVIAMDRSSVCKGFEKVATMQLEKHYYLTAVLIAMRPNFKERELHPAVHKALKDGHIAKDWHLLALESPTVAEDGSRVAYTQSEEKRARNLNTATSIGKYLRRHFPDMADHVIRDYDARFRPATFEIWKGAEKLVKAAQEGPYSCMSWRNDAPEEHAYNVYTEEYGWAMAVRLKNGKIVGRCLLNDKTYVRSYKAMDENDPLAGGTSYADEALEAWLNEQGYEKACDWEGHKFAKYQNLVPYIDGDVQRVTDNGTHWYICDYGEYEATNTDGTYEDSHSWTCDNCEEGMHDHDEQCGISSEDGDVEESWCEHCYFNHAVTVYGRNGREYSVDGRRENYYIYDGECYLAEYLNDNDMVLLDDGDICPSHSAEWVEDKAIYVHESEVSDDIHNYPRYDYYEVKSGEIYHRDSVVPCAQQEEFILKEEALELTDGTFVHRDHMDAYFESIGVDFEEKAKLLGENYRTVYPADPNQLELV